MNERGNGKVALITGSGRERVGNVVARSLAGWGYDVALHYHRSEHSARQTVDELRAMGVSSEAFRADVSDSSQVDAMFENLVGRFGRLDVLVTTASIWESISLEDVTAEDVLRHFRVDALGTFLCARRAGLIMTSQPEGGAIVTFADWAVKRPYLDHAAYFMAKGCIPTLTRVLAVELSHRNPRVRVNCIQPGPVLFPPEATEAQRQAMVDSTLVKSANCPESISLAVKFFIDNPFVTGVCLPVDGGRSIYATESTTVSRPI
jgi:pteridine reductase